MTTPSYGRGDGRPYDGPASSQDALFVSPEGQPLQVSPEAQSMVDQGSTPYQPDVSALIQQMTDLEDRIKTMQEERGIPTNPVEFALQNLRDHVTARKNSTYTLDTTDLDVSLEEFEKNPTSANAELVALDVDDLCARNRGVDLSYLPQLARDVRRAVLVKAGASDDQAKNIVRGASV